MTKKELKIMLIQVRDGAFITPILERIWHEINGFNHQECDAREYEKGE